MFTWDWHRNWWMGTWLQGFSRRLEWLLPLPVPNHGLDGVGRSVQCNHCNIDHHALIYLICQIQSTITGCLASAGGWIPGWIRHVWDKCKINVHAVMNSGCYCAQEGDVKCLDGGKCVWNVSSSNIHLSSWLLSFPPPVRTYTSYFPPSEQFLSLFQLQRPLSHIGFNMQELIRLPSWQV